MPLHADRDGHILVLTISGENAYNAMTQDVYLSLHENLVAFERDPALHVALLTGAGDQHFSAGGHLKRAASTDGGSLFGTEAVLRQFWFPHDQDPQHMIGGVSLLAQHQGYKPVVAAVRGYCLGAGLIILGQQTDLRIAGESAKFGFAELRRGLGGSAAVHSRLQYQIPWVHLMWLVATGSTIDARTALHMGLVNEVVEDDRVVPRAREVAETIAAMPPLAVRAEKQALVHARNMSDSAAMAYASALGALNRLGPDAAEGVAAFAEKRPPQFRGL
jgi:enoyl-CoA hydratase/carnithine racemase